MKWDKEKIAKLADEVDFAKTDDLVPVIVRDLPSRETLMVAFQNREAFEASLSTGEMHYFSRRRGSLWRKGDTSGHIQKIHRVAVDCDADTLLYDVEQVGAGACHEGYFTCFFRKANAEGEWEEQETRTHSAH